MGDQRLLAILTTPDVKQIVCARLDCFAHADRLYLEIVTTPGSASEENGNVPAVGVDVQVLRVEVTDRDLHAACSQ